MKNNDDILVHYASKYYDPDYFHQYYLDHRDEILERKRKNSERKTPVDESVIDRRVERQATMGAVRSGVRKAQKEDTTKLRNEHKAQVKVLRDNTKARMQQMTDKIKGYVKQWTAKYDTNSAQLKKTSAKKQEAISKEAENANTKTIRTATREIDKLKKQIKNSKSPSEKIALQRQINGLTRKVEAEKKSTAIKKAIASGKEKQNLQSQQAKNREEKAETAAKVREAGNKDKQRVRDQVSSAIEASRKTLNDKLTALRENYKTTLKSELQGVKDYYDTQKNTQSTERDYSDIIEKANKKARQMSAERRKRNKQ